MSSYRRVYVPGGVYFFTVVTHERLPIFENPTHIYALRAAFHKVKVARPFEIDAIVVLPDHLHTVWRLPDGDEDFSGRWREIKKAASRAIDTRINARGERPVWQRRFWEHAIRDERDWEKHVDYIHFNPVRHGLAVRPGDWAWSSFGSAVRAGWYEPSWGETEPPDIEGMLLD
ncbi:MAG: REP-associated tyrosine transposase [Panacagrimonas sp.]